MNLPLSGVLPNDLNGAIMPIGTVGENALPVAPIVALPNVITTAPPVQATAVRFPHICLQWKVLVQIVSFMSCLCFGVVCTSLCVLHVKFTRKITRTW